MRFHSKHLLLYVLAAATLLVSACDSLGDDPPSSAETIEVRAKSNIFAAGRSDIPDMPAGGGSGEFPAMLEVAGEEAVMFSSVEGAISPKASLFDMHGPDGGALDSTNINSYDGISGIVHDTTFFFLVGVFLTDDAPTSPAPPRLNVTGYEGQTVVSSLQIGQTFYIGDGRDASGTIQRFDVPQGATRLYLGIADTPGDQGPPGFYHDNAGELQLEHRFVSSE